MRYLHFTHHLLFTFQSGIYSVFTRYKRTFNVLSTAPAYSSRLVLILAYHWLPTGKWAWFCRYFCIYHHPSPFPTHFLLPYFYTLQTIAYKLIQFYIVTISLLFRCINLPYPSTFHSTTAVQPTFPTVSSTYIHMYTYIDIQCLSKVV